MKQTPFISYNPNLKEKARNNRKPQTSAEDLLWREVRNRNLGFKFTRQKPIDQYILDFYCSELLLGIEADGDSHEGKEEYDKERTKVLEGQGIKIVRFTNDEVLYNLDNLVLHMKKVLQERFDELNPPLTPPLSGRGTTESITVNLPTKTTIQLTPTSPFHFDATFFKPDHFTTSDNDYEIGIRWQTMNWEGEKVGLKFINAGNVTNPSISLEIYSKTKLSEQYLNSLVKEVEYRFNLKLDLSDFYKKFEKHKYLKTSIRNLYGMRPGHPSSLYEYLIIGIILQNASIRRSTQMFWNLLSRYGTELNFDGKTFLCLWSPGDLKNVSEEELRALKVGYRAKSIKKIDEQFASGLINEFDLRKMSVEVQKKALLALYGVGPATVWYLLFDVFHNLGVFEHISPWEQKLYSQMFFKRGLDNLSTVQELLEFINQFGEYKQLAIHYLWEDLWWRRQSGEVIEWLEKEIRR
jgi:very-short-patch-repair endonuclease/3-methyladenine DNA glycosylase/8-oxoguanine DNA glycosylase